MKRLYLNLLTLCLFATTHLVHANGFFPNRGVIKITTILSNGDKNFGFGFIVYEENDKLYAVTAKHVVRSKAFNTSTSEVIIGLYEGRSDISATVCSADEELDLALLKFDSPANFLWEFRDITKAAEPGERISLIGRYGTWSESREETMGTVVEVLPAEIRAEFSGAAVGSSGGPLIAGGKIIGMITSDEGNQIIAIPISIIRNKISQWLNINYHKISDLPLTHIGVSLGGSYKFGNLKYSSIEEGSFIFYLGGFIKNSFHEHFSFRLDGTYRKIKTKSMKEYGPFNQFRNSLYTLSGSFHVNLGSNVQYINDIKPGFSHFFVGCSYVRIDPQVNIEKTGWKALKNINRGALDYSNNFYSLLFGITLEGGNFPCFSMEIDIALEYFMNKYVYTNVHNDRYGKDTSNDWLLSANLKIGYLFRPSSSATKMIR